MSFDDLVYLSEEELAQVEAPLTPVWEHPKKSRVQTFDIHPEIPMADRHTFELASHEIEEVNKKERFHRNYAAITVLKRCQEENRFATPDEQIILSKYVGWGGIPEAFDERAVSWQTEFGMLKNILTPEEYASARESTLTAFYTPPTVINAVYKVMKQLGFREGNILEPSCGIGHFIGMLPEEMKESKIYGVELDTVSAGIAQQLYQKSSVAAQGFEETNLPDSFFDAVVGNVPFGDFKVPDKRYDKHKFLIHDYFFAKSLDKLRPGGVMALITSKGTMDKENSAVRKYIAQRADLLGAIRLPNNTFKGNAGTEVVSDILILQKRDRIVDIEPDWVQLGTDENGILMNSYFVEHPEMILGEMKMVSGRFGPEATCVPYEGADLAEQLSEAVSNIHGELTAYEVEDELAEEDNSIPADPTVRNFSYTVLDDNIYFRENSRMAPVEVSATAENRIKGMIRIRDSVRKLIELQTEDYPDSEIKAEQERLNALYDTFSKQYGLINSRANISAFSQDSSCSLLSALEVLGDEGQLERKADIFYKRTIKPHTPVTSVDTSSEALAVSMGEKARVDMDYMTKKKQVGVRFDSNRTRLKTGETQRPNGTYAYRWSTPDGKRHSIYAPTLEKLREQEEQIIVDKHDGIRSDVKSITVNEMFNLWCQLKRGIKDSTFKNYIYMYELFVKPSFGKNRLVQVKKSDVRKFYNSLADGKVLKIATIDNVHNVLHQVFQVAVDDGMIRQNPTDNMLKELKLSHGFEREKKEALTVAQQKLFFDYMLSHPKDTHWYPVFYVMANTGMRVGEITGLRWSDIDLKKGIIRVNHTLVYYNHRDEKGCYFSINTPKTKAGEREIPMTEGVKQAFLMEREFQSQAEISSKSRVDGYDDFIFVNRYGDVQNQGNLNKALRRMMRDCNDEILEKYGADSDPVLLPQFSCHILRHTFATRLCESGANLKFIQSILGHADVSTTMNIYVDVTDALKKKEITAFDDYMTTKLET